MTAVASEVMTRDFVRAAPEASLFVAFELLTQHGVHHLPVLTAEGRCVTMLDAIDVFGRLPEAWLHGEVTVLPRPGAAGPISVLPDTPLPRVAALMSNADVDACCVVDEHGRMLGLITARDIVAAVADMRETEVVTCAPGG